MGVISVHLTLTEKAAQEVKGISLATQLSLPNGSPFPGIGDEITLKVGDSSVQFTVMRRMFALEAGTTGLHLTLVVGRTR